MAQSKEILDQGTIHRTLTRIAHEILEQNKGVDNLCFVGIRTRGIHIANRLMKKIEQIEGKTVEVGELDITFYRDDREERTNERDPYVRIATLPFDITNKKVILIDDVLYTGRTIRGAMDALMDQGRPAMIQLAVLVDRGHRELPIRPDYVGKNIPTAQTEKVIVQLTESDAVDSVCVYTADSCEQCEINL